MPSGIRKADGVKERGVVNIQKSLRGFVPPWRRGPEGNIRVIVRRVLGEVTGRGLDRSRGKSLGSNAVQFAAQNAALGTSSPDGNLSCAYFLGTT